MRRYLLGECSEGEQSTLEEAYFADPRLFDAVTKAESALVDDYVRGRLSPDVRRRFEQVYLADPRRRERVRFAEALAARLDRSGWRPSLDAFGGWRAAAVLAAASLLIVSGILFVVESRRSPQESRAHIADPHASSTIPAKVEKPSAAFVTLALVVGPGVRGDVTGAPATLVITPETTEVRLELRLREHDYPTYRVVLRAIGGAEILRRPDVEPTSTSSGATITLTLAANQFETGDYMLTLQGAPAGGQFEDLSQSLFRVQRTK